MSRVKEIESMISSKSIWRTGKMVPQGRGGQGVEAGELRSAPPFASRRLVDDEQEFALASHYRQHTSKPVEVSSDTWKMTAKHSTVDGDSHDSRQTNPSRSRW